MRIRLAGKTERVKVRCRTCGEYPLELRPELIRARGLNGQKTFLLPERQPVRRDLRAGEVHHHFRLQILQNCEARRFQFDEHRAVQQAFSVLSDIREQFDNVLQVPLRLHRFGNVVAVGFEFVLPSGVLDDLALFHRLDQPMIDAQSHAVLFRELCEDRLLVRGRWIFAYRPRAAVTVAHDVMVRIKLDRTRRNTGEKIFCPDTLRFFFRRALFCFVLSHVSLLLGIKKAALLFRKTACLSLFFFSAFTSSGYNLPRHSSPRHLPRDPPAAHGFRQSFANFQCAVRPFGQSLPFCFR